MTDQQDDFVPTYSHQPLPPAAARPAAYGSLGAALEAATAAMAPSFVDASESVGAERLRGLRPVRDQLPSNTHVSLDELAARVPPKLLPIVKAWGWFSGNLVVVGPTRAGKTSAAALLVRLLLDRARSELPLPFTPSERKFWGGCATTFQLAELIRWQSCRDLTNTAREYPLGQGAPETIQRCQNARLLVLDDVGATDDKAVLERILNARYERRWPTITTSGLTSRELVGTFGEALVRRMSERGGVQGQIVSLFPA